ncbi:MAG: YggT family protein [Myxococcota bacterium]
MEFVIFALEAYQWMVIAAVLLSWFRLDPENPLVSLLDTFTEPPLSLIRRFMPDTGGLDFSPIILIVLLRLAQGFIANNFGPGVPIS